MPGHQLVVYPNWVNFLDQYAQHLVVMQKLHSHVLSFYQVQAQDVLLYLFTVIVHFNIDV